MLTLTELNAWSKVIGRLKYAMLSTRDEILANDETDIIRQVLTEWGSGLSMIQQSIEHEINAPSIDLATLPIKLQTWQKEEQQPVD